ncbi:MAG: UDP-N-acetylmuramoyl-L-alanyl-D-glutamate--2,6-diaminopimelate ligase [Clostridiales bacterium]|nr:UDP-N-acetylmuramoyl-L-alanyl-D-glutamate--2,6-diaminopimelate ligase [Clostridiales bacterium]
MRLSEIIKNVEIIDKFNFIDTDVDDLDIDSREVFSKSLFFAVKGNNTDGNLYINEAVKRGAVAVVSENKNDVKVPQIIVKDIKETISKIAYNFYKPKNKRPKLIAVVGTNGKTTTTFMIKNILEEAGINAGVIGTLGAFYNKAYVEPSLTTPDSLSFYKLVMDMANSDVEYVIFELSAHAIEQKRLGDIKLEGIVFTNCTQDHLDYFETFSDYENTKMSVFTQNKCEFAVINSDDETGKKIILNNNVKTFTYGLENPSDVFAVNVKSNVNGINFVMNLFDDIVNIKYPSTGRFNVYNCLGASTLASVMGISSRAIRNGLSKLKVVPGRMEFVESFNGANVYIDYAHTPDGLENLLKSLKEVTKNKLILVFGCGGNRDKSKREIMGEIAGKYADFTVITSDNPRYEEPYQIISQIEKGIRKTNLCYITIQNREMAIGYALTKLSSGDTMVVAGKGAEEYQEIMGVKLKFIDKEVIKETIAKLDFSGDLI